MFVCAFPVAYWLICRVCWDNYFMDSVMVKKTAFIFLVLVSLACNMQALPAQAVDVVTPSSDVSSPVKVVASHEPTETAPIYVTTAPLNVRSEANADSQILGMLEAGQVIVIFIPIPEIKGDDCYMGEWYETRWDEVTAYVCSLYIEER